MDLIDRNYLQTQFRLRVHEKNHSEFQSFFENIMLLKFQDFLKIRPYGNQGDGGNDGCRLEAGIYYQVYSPSHPKEKDEEAARKLISDFNKLKLHWDSISSIKTFFFVYNNKYTGSSIPIEHTLAELGSANPGIAFKKLFSKDLEDIFFSLSESQILSLGFDISATNAILFAQDYLKKLEIWLDRGNGSFVLKSIENLKEILSRLADENLNLEYEILECRALTKTEKIVEAKEKYENICKRFPSDPRAFLYLAEIYLNLEDHDKNYELLSKAEKIDDSHWLLKIERMIRELRLFIKVDEKKIDESKFPSDSRIKADFYRLYSLQFEQIGKIEKADSYIERAISLNPDKLYNFEVKLSIIEDRILKIKEDHILKLQADDLLKEIDRMQEKASEWSALTPRNELILICKRIPIYDFFMNVSEIAKLTENAFNLVFKCYFDYTIDRILVGLLSLVEVPQDYFDQLLEYLKIATKSISLELAKSLIIQFLFKDTLITIGKTFFTVLRNEPILSFISNLENHQYDRLFEFIENDVRFAALIVNFAKKYPDLRRFIIEKLPNDGNINKTKLQLLLEYEEHNFDEAYTLLKGLDFSTLSYYECVPILEIAQKKNSWDFVVLIIEKLLPNEMDPRSILSLKLQLFSANFSLNRFHEVIRIGEEIILNSQDLSILDYRNKEALVSQTLIAHLNRGEYCQAKVLIEKCQTNTFSYNFKIGIEAEIFLKNNEAQNALKSIVEGIKIRKTPTPEEYGGLYLFFVEIENLTGFGPESLHCVQSNCFVKISDQQQWYYIGDEEELDASIIKSADYRYQLFIDKKIGEKITITEQYRSQITELIIENILTIEQYIFWQCIHNAQQLSLEHRWDKMEIIEVPQIENAIDPKYMIARLEAEKSKKGDFFEQYINEYFPLSFLSISEGSLLKAIGRIVNENKGFIRCSSGNLKDFIEQNQIAKKITSGSAFYIDGTSAFVLSESGIFPKIHQYLPNLRVPQSVLTFLFECKKRMEFSPGQVGTISYSQGKLRIREINHDLKEKIHNSFKNSINLMEQNPENIYVISDVNKESVFSEQRVPAELCDACILAQRDNAIISTEDFLYLQANQIETKKKIPEFLSSFSLIKFLYDDKKLSFDDYLNYFYYLARYRFRFLHITQEDIEKAVFGDGPVTIIKPENIRKFNFKLTISNEYGVDFELALMFICRFFIKVIIDDSISIDITNKIFIEIINEFPIGKSDRQELSRMILGAIVKRIKNSQSRLIVGLYIEEKIKSLLNIRELFFNKRNIQLE